MILRKDKNKIKRLFHDFESFNLLSRGWRFVWLSDRHYSANTNGTLTILSHYRTRRYTPNKNMKTC